MRITFKSVPLVETSKEIFTYLFSVRMFLYSVSNHETDTAATIFMTTAIWVAAKVTMTMKRKAMTFAVERAMEFVSVTLPVWISKIGVLPRAPFLLSVYNSSITTLL